MNFEDFEKKAKCIFCERPINIRMSHIKKGKHYRCECSLSSRIQFKDGYIFTLPACAKYQILVNSVTKIVRVDLITAQKGTQAYNPPSVLEFLFELSEVPDFITLPRLEVIQKIDDLLAFL